MKARFYRIICERSYYHARDHTSYPYKFSGCTLQSVTETVDLGVSLTSNLTWNTQTQKVVNKANKIVSFLKRNVGAGNKEVFSRLYKALVIPHSGICCPFLASPQTSFGVRLSRIQCVTNEPQRTSAGRLVPFWSPYLQKNIDALPMSCRESPYEERLTMLRWINQGGLIYLC